MNIKERLKLDYRETITLDPSNHNDFIDYDFWEPTIEKICQTILKEDVTFYYTKTSKYQCLQTTTTGKKYIVIDDNFIYILGRFSSIAAQIWYAKLSLSDRKKTEKFIQNAYAQYDVLLSRIEAVNYVFGNKTDAFIMHNIEFIQSEDASENYDKRLLDEYRKLIGPDADIYNIDLNTVIEMQYIWVVVHEIAHCYFEENKTTKEQMLAPIKTFASEQIKSHQNTNSKENQFLIESLNKLLEAGNGSLEEVACDAFSLHYVIEIFTQKLNDKKLALVLTRVAFALMDFNLRIVNVIRAMSDELVMYNPSTDLKEDISKKVKRDTKRLQEEYYARFKYIDYCLRIEDGKVFRSEADIDKDLDSFLSVYISTAEELMTYGMDYTSMSYLNNFFEIASVFFNSKKPSKSKELRKNVKELFQWTDEGYPLNKSIIADEIELLNKEEFEGYIDFLCFKKYSIEGKMTRTTSLQDPELYFQSFSISEAGATYGNIALYTNGSLTESHINGIIELANRSNFNSPDLRMRIFTNCIVDNEIKNFLREKISGKIIDIQMLKTDLIKIKPAEISSGIENLKMLSFIQQ